MTEQAVSGLLENRIFDDIKSIYIEKNKGFYFKMEIKTDKDGEPIVITLPKVSLYPIKIESYGKNYNDGVWPMSNSRQDYAISIVGDLLPDEKGAIYYTEEEGVPMTLEEIERELGQKIKLIL